MLPVSREVKARVRKARGKAPVRTETVKVLAKAKRGAEVGRSPRMAKASAVTLEKGQSHPTGSKVTRATRRKFANCTSRESARRAVPVPVSTTHLVDFSKEASAQKVENACSLITRRQPQQPSRRTKKRAEHLAMRANPSLEGARGANGAAKADEASLRQLLSVSDAPGELGADPVLQWP